MDNENLVLILSKQQTTFDCKKAEKPLEDIALEDIWPTLNIAAANADVVIMKEGSRFKVLKHKFMGNLVTPIYHTSMLKNIIFARDNK